MQDLAIVGMGLIGSAALRHAARSATVIGIGPTEPQDRADHAGPYASHFDAGRITRRLDVRREWSVLASRAIAEYPTIEARSGIAFHHPAGLVYARHDREGLDQLRAIAAEHDIPILDGEDGRAVAAAGGLAFPDGDTVIAEPAPAGAIDPRAMIRAQHVAAEADGALVARDTVVSIRPALDGFELLTAAGRTHQARNVLVATGAYGNDLAPVPMAMAIQPEVIVRAEVDEVGAARLASMPSVIHLMDDPVLPHVYLVPPVRYPDGRLWVKIGGFHGGEPLEDTAAANRWMADEVHPDVVARLRAVLERLVPEVTFRAWDSAPCLIADTASGLPYIDRLDGGLTIAVGGNGHAAKSSDAIGALAASLALTGRWADQELSAESFAVRLGSWRRAEPKPW